MLDDLLIRPQILLIIAKVFTKVAVTISIPPITTEFIGGLDNMRDVGTSGGRVLY